MLFPALRQRLHGLSGDVLTVALIALAFAFIFISLAMPAPVKAAVLVWALLP